jgi:alpha-beta hydrolase superfamily lysophospholipase
LSPEPAHRVVSSFDGTEIHFDVYEAGSDVAILVIPGFWRDRRHPSMTRLAAWFQGEGLRCAVMDSRGHGQSGGRYGFNLNEHQDVAAVGWNLLRDVPVSRLVLVGFSYGGAIAISTAARHALPIDSLILISPVADFAMIAPRMNLFTMHRHIAFSQALKRPRFGWNLRRSPTLRAADDIRSVDAPVCLIHIKDDWLISHRHSEILYEAAAGPRELHLLDLPGNYHADRIFTVAPGRVETILRDFLRKRIPRPPG